jgi:hypothetical protein
LLHAGCSKSLSLVVASFSAGTKCGMLLLWFFVVVAVNVNKYYFYEFTLFAVSLVSKLMLLDLTIKVCGVLSSSSRSDPGCDLHEIHVRQGCLCVAAC